MIIRTILTAAYGQYRYRRAGIIAQGLTFASIFVPVIFRMDEALVFFLQTSAATTVLLQVATLAVATRLPTAGDELVVRTIGAALWFLIALSILMMLTGAFGIALGGNRFFEVQAAAGAFILAQGLGAITLACLVRNSDYSGVLNYRLVYAVWLFSLTLAASLMDASGTGLVLFTAASHVLATSYAVRRLKVNRATLTHAIFALGPRDLYREVRAASTLMLSSLLGSVGGQLGGLTLAMVGPFQSSWAAVIRVTTGFQTVGSRLFGPEIDALAGRAVRGQDVNELHRALRFGTRVGTGIAVASAVFAVIGAIWVQPEVFADSPMAVSLIASGIAFAGFGALTSPIDRFVGLAGSHYMRLMWDTGRSLGAVAVVVAFEGSALIVAIATLTTISTFSYLVLARRAATSLQQPD